MSADDDTDVPDGPNSDHWDPSPAERIYYREKQSGQLGWLVRRDGKDFIRLDRSAQELIVPMRGWDADDSHKPLTIGHLAQICFEADKALCRYIGLQENARKSWADLSDDKRIEWMKYGPTKDVLRRDLYRAIRDGMKGHTQ